MSFWFDIIPMIAFFVAYKWKGIYVATVVAIGLSFVHLLYSRIKSGRFEKMPLITFGSLAILGSATLVTQNENYIKLKPTVVYWVLALAFALTPYIGVRKTVLEHLATHTISLKKTIWQALNRSWIIFFLVMGALNLWVMKSFDTNTWMNFKVFGALGLTVLFIFIQGAVMAKYAHTPFKDNT